MDLNSAIWTCDRFEGIAYRFVLEQEGEYSTQLPDRLPQALLDFQAKSGGCAFNFCDRDFAPRAPISQSLTEVLALRIRLLFRRIKAQRKTSP
jgi:hypothetical protein